MRRIYESDALSRDDDSPFQPGTDSEYTPQSFRSVDAQTWSDRLVPHALRCRSVSVELSMPQTEFEVGEPIPFTVQMRNAMPVPLTLRTASPVLWRWQIDGLTEASHVPLRNPPAEQGAFRFNRGERKRFHKEWGQRFKISEHEWTAAEPDEYLLRVEINVDDPEGAGLVDEQRIRIRD